MPKYSPFQIRHRRAARASLYSSFALAGLIVFLLGLLIGERLLIIDDSSRSLAEWEAVREVRLLRDYVRIDTRERELEGAQWLYAQLSELGLDPVLEEVGDGRANVWAVLEGETPEALVLHNHIDVFRVLSPEAWDHPPFAGVIEPPFLHGRGVFDMKSLAIAQLEAIRALAESDSKPYRSVIFLATADEESGSRLGTSWVLREHPELAARFELVLTEGGVVEPLSTTEVKYWGIETAQRRYAEGWACAPERGVLEDLYRSLKDQVDGDGMPRVTPDVERFMASYAPSRQDGHLTWVLEQIVSGQTDPIDFGRLPRYLRSFFLDEIFPFPIEEVEGGGFRMRLVGLLLPGGDLEALRAEKLPDWMAHGVTIAFGPAIGIDGGSPTDSDRFRVLVDSLSSAHPQATIGAYFLHSSATDSRFFRRLGIPSYGFSPFLLFNTESFRADDLNERINLPGFVEGVELYVGVVNELANHEQSV